MRNWGIVALGAALAGCGIAAQNAARETIASTKSCISDVKDSDDGKVVFARMWAGDESDTAAKLNDQKSLAPNERDAFVRVHQSMLKCRQLILQHDMKYAAWEAPIWQDFFARSDVIFTKTVSGEITVAQANKLGIESTGMLQSALARGNATAVAEAEAQRQRASEAMLQAGTQLLASSQSHTTNCSWIGNTMSCTSR